MDYLNANWSDNIFMTLAVFLYEGHYEHFVRIQHVKYFFDRLFIGTAYDIDERSKAGELLCSRMPFTLHCMLVLRKFDNTFHNYQKVLTYSLRTGLKIKLSM